MKTKAYTCNITSKTKLQNTLIKNAYYATPKFYHVCNGLIQAKTNDSK